MARLCALLALLALGACASPSDGTCRAPLKTAIEVDLYFGRDIDGRAEVSDADWAKFLADEVTPRFPDGLSVSEVAGQYRDPSGRIVRERSKRLVVAVFDAPAHAAKVQAIVDTYKARFGQHSLLRVERPVCAGL